MIEIIDEETAHTTYRYSRSDSDPEFNWGFNGSGPWYVAEFLLRDVTGDDNVVKKFTLTFVNQFVSRWNDGWVITSDEIRQWIVSQQN